MSEELIEMLQDYATLDRIAGNFYNNWHAEGGDLGNGNLLIAMEYDGRATGMRTVLEAVGFTFSEVE